MDGEAKCKEEVLGLGSADVVNAEGRFSKKHGGRASCPGRVWCERVIFEGGKWEAREGIGER